MKLNVTISCSICNFKSKNKVELPFDCDTLLCPSCGGENCLSILTVHDELSMFNSQGIQKRLQRMRELHVS
jgi:hypothetical protein